MSIFGPRDAHSVRSAASFEPELVATASEKQEMETQRNEMEKFWSFWLANKTNEPHSFAAAATSVA